MPKQRHKRSDYRTRRPRVEQLEKRRMLATFTVSTTADDGPGSLREAILLANADSAPDEIGFDSTVFATPQTIALASQLPTISQPLTIQGPASGQLTLDAGNGADSVFNTNDGFRIFDIDDGDAATRIPVEIRDLILTGGDTPGSGGALLNSENLTLGTSRLTRNSAAMAGGAVSNTGTLLVQSSELLENSADNGGGIHSTRDVTVTDSLLAQNTAQNNGGGLFNAAIASLIGSDFQSNSSRRGGGVFSDNTLSITETTFSSNSADFGGGLDNAFGGAVIQDSTFTGNQARLSGGAVDNGGGLSIENSVLSNNFTTLTGSIGGAFANQGFLGIADSLLANNSAGGGGAIQNGGTSGRLEIENSTLTGNTAFEDHGGAIINYGDAAISSSTLAANSAISDGGGIFNRSQNAEESLRLSNTTLFGNSASNGGGIANSIDGVLSISNSTISGNPGGGVFNHEEAAASINHSIIAGSGPSRDLSNASGSLTGAYNLIEDGMGAGLHNTISGDPRLGGPADNGGPTQTLAPLPDSPAINAGRQAAGMSGEIFDQRGPGFPRVVLGVIDLGAVEFQDFTIPAEGLVVSTTEDTVDNDFSSGELSLREAVELANSSSGPDLITFEPSLFGAEQSIALARGLRITDATVIDGPGANRLTIDGGNGGDGVFNTGDGFTLLEVDDGDSGNTVRVSISGVTLTGGDASGATAAEGSGGGVRNAEELTLRDSHLSGNAASFSGGAAYSTGVLSIAASTISGNAAPYGGGVLNDGPATITNSTVSSNTATGNGGGVANYGALVIANSTLAANSASNGGGVFNFDLLGTTTITGSIVAGGSGPGLAGTFTGGFNLVEDGTGGLTDSVVADPLLGGLMNNGGATPTHALLPGSPAIDSGSPAFNPNAFAPPLLFDQRGAPFARVENGRVDIGAFESQAPPSFPAGDFNRDGVVSPADYVVFRDTLGSPVPNNGDGADGNGNGTVDASDFDVFAGNFGGTQAESPPPGAVVAAATMPATAAAAPALNFTPTTKAATPAAAPSPAQDPGATTTGGLLTLALASAKESTDAGREDLNASALDALALDEAFAAEEEGADDPLALTLRIL